MQDNKQNKGYKQVYYQIEYILDNSNKTKQQLT